MSKNNKKIAEIPVKVRGKMTKGMVIAGVTALSLSGLGVGAYAAYTAYVATAEYSAPGFAKESKGAYVYKDENGIERIRLDADDIDALRSYSDDMDQILAMQLAPIYNENSVYNVDDFAIIKMGVDSSKGKTGAYYLVQCTDNSITGTFNPTKWRNVTIDDLVQTVTYTALYGETNQPAEYRTGVAFEPGSYFTYNGDIYFVSGKITSSENTSFGAIASKVTAQNSLMAKMAELVNALSIKEWEQSASYNCGQFVTYKQKIFKVKSGSSITTKTVPTGTLPTNTTYWEEVSDLMSIIGSLQEDIGALNELCEKLGSTNVETKEVVEDVTSSLGENATPTKAYKPGDVVINNNKLYICKKAYTANTTGDVNNLINNYFELTTVDKLTDNMRKYDINVSQTSGKYTLEIKAEY